MITFNTCEYVYIYIQNLFVISQCLFVLHNKYNYSRTFDDA